jgi:septal ring-binding cell division protein DamX
VDDVSPPTPDETTPPAPVEDGDCPRCGTPYAAGQEYCLECGLRLPESVGAVGALGTAWRRRVRWYPGDWIWAALLGLAVAAIAATVVILADQGNAGGDRLVATDNRPVGTNEETTTAATATTTTTTAETTTAATTTTTAPPPPSNELKSWPAGRTGYTVVLNSIPTTSGRARAVEEARKAQRAGLEDVGVLTSSEFSTLHPGYYVVFSGIYGTSSEATGAVSDARSAGFETPYPRQIAR